MRKYFIISVILFTLALVATAEAKQANPCKDWATAQTSDGQRIFETKSQCKAHEGELFQPRATISPSHVVAGETFTLTATGFHADAHSTVYFAITGDAPYGSYTPSYPTDADGNFSIPFRFAACRQIDTGGDVTVDLTLAFVDSFGVHASARLTLC